MEITALKYEDENTIDFAITQEQRREFREMVADMNKQTGEDWSTYLSEVDVEHYTDGDIVCNGTAYAPSKSKGDGFYIAIQQL